MMPKIRMHLTSYSGLRQLVPTGAAGRWAANALCNRSQNH